MELGKNVLHDAASLKVLDQRAELLKVKENRSVDVEEDSLICFELGKNENYAISYNQIVTIIPFQNIVPLPGVMSVIKGLTYYDGCVLTVIDLNKLLMLSEEFDEQLSSFILVGNEKDKIALQVNCLLDPIRYSKNTVLGSLPEEMAHCSHFIKGIYNGKVALLDCDAVFNDSTIKIDQRLLHKGEENV